MASSAAAPGDSFSFEHVLLAEASNKTRHPRASIHELQCILRPNDAASHQPDKNVGHWWEAQLLHYGLKLSKTKSVAKTRLLDALNAGTLAVPGDIKKLEGQLKKSWTKSEKDKRNELTPVSTAKSGAKRKRGDETNQSAQAKKAKAVPATKAQKQTAVAKSPKAAPKTAPNTASKKTPNVTSAKTSGPSSSSKDINGAQFKPTNHPRTKQTARRGGNALPVGRVIPSESNNVPDPFHRAPRTKQTARRGKPFQPGRGLTANGRTPGSWDEDDNTIGMDGDDDDEDNDIESGNGEEKIDWVPSGPKIFSSLGLINGTYEIDCPTLEDWGRSSEDFSLILCLEGDSVWGSYDFGMFSGILHLRQRPYTGSDERLPFSWRGRENSEGVISFGPGNEGWIEFHGGGRIVGMINCYGNAEFQGTRTSGNQTRGGRPLRSMHQEWDKYNEREYERENRARWGGSGW